MARMKRANSERVEKYPKGRGAAPAVPDLVCGVVLFKDLGADGSPVEDPDAVFLGPGPDFCVASLVGAGLPGRLRRSSLKVRKAALKFRALSALRSIS